GRGSGAGVTGSTGLWFSPRRGHEPRRGRRVSMSPAPAWRSPQEAADQRANKSGQSGGLGRYHPFGIDYGHSEGGGARGHGEAKPPETLRRDLPENVPLPARDHTAALVQPLDPDPNAPGVHRSVVEHPSTHRLKPLSRRVQLPSDPQAASAHTFLSLARP